MTDDGDTVVGAHATLDRPAAFVPVPQIGAGTRVGPYVVVELLGRGGVGDVYRARDERLERDVAVKILRDVPAARLVAEAQAMARLAHPNVVTVYEVGEHAGSVYLAMELVRGATLAEWLAAAPREARDIVDIFVQAGRGLAAAHAAGIVHRDFKPANVLVGEDGRARVSDFGLARGASEGEDSGEGTPVYMAPEQHLGQTVDARADQFAFAVALHRALHGGEHPFAGTSYDEIRDEVVAGRLRAAPKGRLAAVVARALARDPDARHPTMEAFLASLARVGTTRRLAVAAAALVAAALAIFLVARLTAPAPEACPDASPRLAAVWDAAARDRVRAAFLATGRPYAADTFARVAETLDGYAERWVATRREVCAATAVRHEQSPALFDQRMTCLDGRLGELGALAAQLARGPDTDVLDHAAAGAHRLVPLSSCDATSGALPEPTDPTTRARMTELRGRIAEVRALSLAGKFRDAVPQGQKVADDAAALAVPAVEIEALAALNFLRGMRKNMKDNRANLDRLLDAAARAHDDVWVAKALAIIAEDSATFGDRPADALPMLPVADAAVMRAGNTPNLRSRFLMAAGNVQHVLGNESAAETAFRLGLMVSRVDRDADAVDQAAYLNLLGIAIEHQQRWGDALVQYQRARDLYANVLGPDHPYVAGMGINLSHILRNEGRLAETRAELERSLASFTAALGPDGNDLAIVYTNLGDLSRIEGRWDEAERELLRGVAIKERGFGVDNPRVASTLGSLGRLYLETGRVTDAERTVARELAIREAKAPDTADAVFAYALQASVRVAQGRPKDALTVADQALAVAGAKFPPPSVAYVAATVARGEALRALGRPGDALAALRAVTSDDPTLALEEGLALAALRRPDEARPILEKLLADGKLSAANRARALIRRR